MDLCNEDSRSRKLSAVVPVTSMDSTELSFSYLVIVYPPASFELLLPLQHTCQNLRSTIQRCIVFTASHQTYDSNDLNSIHVRRVSWKDTLTCICKKTLANTRTHTCTCYIASSIDYKYTYKHMYTQSHGPRGDWQLHSSMFLPREKPR